LSEIKELKNEDKRKEKSVCCLSQSTQVVSSNANNNVVLSEVQCHLAAFVCELQIMMFFGLVKDGVPI